MYKLIFYLYIASFLFLFNACENEGKDLLNDLNAFKEWSIDTKPNYNIPGDLKPLSSSTLASIVRLKNEPLRIENDEFIADDIRELRVMAIINFKNDDYFLKEIDIERLYYIAEAQIFEKFVVTLVSEGNASNSYKIMESIKNKLLLFKVNQNNVKVLFENISKENFLRVKILR